MDEGITERLVLVIEDDRDHAELIKHTLNAHSTHYQVVVVSDSTHAMQFLRQTGDYVDAPRPNLILLNLDLPKKDGRAFLAEIKADIKLKRIPIVILTASNDEQDVFAAYELQGNCYVIKTEDVNQLSAIVQRIEEFWLGIVTLPME